MESHIPKERYKHPKDQISLYVIITNGDPASEVRLRFDFESRQRNTAVWIARLPPIHNRDAAPLPLTKQLFELRLAAVNETEPIEVLSFDQTSIQSWLSDGPGRKYPPHTELLVFAHQRQFTVTLSQKN